MFSRSEVEGQAERLQREKLRVLAAVLDVTDSAGVTAFFDSVVESHGTLDILVNNAGVGQKVMPTVDVPDEEWRRVMNVTLDGAFHCCRAAGAIMERQESGSIVNISSNQRAESRGAGGGLQRCEGRSHHADEDAGARTGGVRRARQRRLPGPVFTDFNKSVMDQRRESLGISMDEMVTRIEQAVPLGRWGEASDIASAVAFLCSPDASWITGEVLRVSGGLEGVSAAPPKRTRD